MAMGLVNGIFYRYGAPETLHSDQGRNFDADVMAEGYRLFGIAKTRSTASWSTVLVLDVCTVEFARGQKKVFGLSSSSVLAFDCLIKYILTVCRLIVAMPSGKRETERKGNRRLIPARRQIATDAPIIWWKKRTSMLEGAARYTAYHPQSDGLVGKMNRTLIDMPAKVSIDHPEDWNVHLDRVLLTYRSSVHHTTGATPAG
ncbi:hypothetical protein T07_6039 [Trichinella nelsoni]|uniref:Integrase catalytic domain-containing protein n=1 Tax=Trichinella nelsoni TaxID=6336 RepID=A0A0V0RP99_9BILA|nr:hypothetical protein T07_6039 [Trichinella nelsoni]